MNQQIVKLYGQTELSEHNMLSIENETGTGQIQLIEIVQGIVIAFNYMNLLYCTKETVTRFGMLEINYCHEGRYECNIGQQLYCYLTSGMLSVSHPVHSTKCACFPNGYYIGISIFIDEQMQTVQTFLQQFDIHINQIVSLLSNEAQCFIVQNNLKIQQIFDEINTAFDGNKIGFLRIKTAELLFLLSHLSATENDSSLRYMNSHQVQTAKNVQAHIISNLARHYTLSELAAYAGISETALKCDFKGVFGTSVYAYLKAYRMAVAQELLRKTDLSVAEIAAQVGYENPNKFSTEFKRFSKYSPSEYRKMCRNG